jgi:hypothetical protein
MVLYITGLVQALGFELTSVRMLTGTGFVKNLQCRDYGFRI